ncbi:hypothetical protein MPH_11951 [Macrophomina phaseolina MS6]|uniref:Uncharacterized protein n=1 Tax=Macrophomina phaseolina (strain MS6) TaxID=1126212 RepID=K2R938_MACPH|nr:hypothetical protein MPH_11951 [Macrophomina phaseolina MS6]
MADLSRKERAAADTLQGEDLSSYLHRLNFKLDSVEGSLCKPSSATLNGAATDRSTTTSFESFTLPPLQDKTNILEPEETSSDPPAHSGDGARSTSAKDVFHRDTYGSELLLHPHPDPKKVPGSLANLLAEDQAEATSKRYSHSTHPNCAEKPRHELPIHALAQTLRASSIGATMAPTISSDNGGLEWSKYAPAGHFLHDGSSRQDLNQRTAQTIARQAEIDARLSKLRARRNPTTEKRDENRRFELMAADKAAKDEQDRLKANRKAEEEAARLEDKRREVEEKKEAERIELLKREKEEAERRQREKEEAERCKREQEEAERIRRGKEEAKRLEAERVEAEKIKREKEVAAEAALRTMLLEKVDQLEKDGLIKTQKQQAELKENTERATVRQQEIITQISRKHSELIEAEEILQRIQNEHKELKDSEAAVNAQIDADNKKCAELQCESELVMKRASNMRRRVEEKSVRSADMLEAITAPDLNNHSRKSTNAPEYGKTLFGHKSRSKSVEESMEVTEETFDVDTGLHSAGVNLGDKSSNRASILADAAESKSEAIEEKEVKNCSPKQTQTAHKKTQSLGNQLRFDKWPSQQNRLFGGR